MTGVDWGLIGTVLGIISVTTGGFAFAWVTARGRGYEALKQAAESWERNALAAQAEVKTREQEIHGLRNKLAENIATITELKTRISRLEAATDLTRVTESLANVRREDDERSNKSMEKMAEHFSQLGKESKQFHEAQISVLNELVSLIREKKLA